MKAEKSFKKMCIEHNINYRTAITYRSRHRNLTDEQVIEKYLNPTETAFTQKCIDAGVNFNKARGYRHYHPELSDEQIIQIYLNDK
jgi:hypothetical protein